MGMRTIKPWTTETVTIHNVKQHIGRGIILSPVSLVIGFNVLVCAVINIR
jgi:hypothetical protein